MYLVAQRYDEHKGTMIANSTNFPKTMLYKKKSFINIGTNFNKISTVNT